MPQQFKAKRANVHANPGGFKLLLQFAHVHIGRPEGPPIRLAQDALRLCIACQWARCLAGLGLCRLTMSQPHHMRSVRPGEFHHIATVTKPGAFHQQTDIHRPVSAQTFHLQAAGYITQQAGRGALCVGKAQFRLCHCLQAAPIPGGLDRTPHSSLSSQRSP